MTKQLYDVTLSQSPPSSCHLTATGVPNPSSTNFSAHANKTRTKTHGGGNGAALSRDSRQRAPRRRLFVAAKSLPRCCCVALSSSPPHSSSVAWPCCAAACRLVPGRAALRASPGRWRLRRPGGDPPQLWEFSRSVLYPGMRFIPPAMEMSTITVYFLLF